VNRRVAHSEIIRGDEDSHIRPEDLTCQVVAEDDTAYHRLRSQQEFSIGWEMTPLVELARRHVSALDAGRSYCLKIPATLGGSYKPDNLASIETLELVSISGDIARQIRDLPDGAQVRLKIVD
jgi:hypothetical protein